MAGEQFVDNDLVAGRIYTDEKQRELTAALVQLFARCLHQVDLEHMGIRAPTKEQMEKWHDKYLGIPDPEAGIPYRIKSNMLRARTDYLVACVHNLVSDVIDKDISELPEHHDEFDRG